MNKKLVYNNYEKLVTDEEYIDIREKIYLLRDNFITYAKEKYNMVLYYVKDEYDALGFSLHINDLDHFYLLPLEEKPIHFRFGFHSSNNIFPKIKIEDLLKDQDEYFEKVLSAYVPGIITES